MAHFYKEGDSRRYRDTSRYLPTGINFSCFDNKRMAEIDTFYMECQRFRDYYKDPKGRCTNFVKGFEPSRPVNELVRNPTEAFMRCPVRFIVAEHPIYYRYTGDEARPK